MPSVVEVHITESIDEFPPDVYTKRRGGTIIEAGRPPCPHCGNIVPRLAAKVTSRQMYYCQECKKSYIPGCHSKKGGNSCKIRLDHPCPFCGAVAAKKKAVLKRQRGTFQRWRCVACQKTWQVLLK